MKRLLYYIEDKIACRFLRMELSKEYAGKALILAFDKMVKEAAKNNTDSLKLTYEITYSNVKYNIENDITIKEVEE